MDAHTIQCSTVWGGIRNIDMDVNTSGVHASLYSQSADGARGGDLYYISVCNADKLTRVAIADVVGHGEAVSQVSGWMYESLVARMNSLEGQAVLSDLNNLAAGRNLDAMTTAVVAGYYRGNGQFYFSYAGHPPVLVHRGGDGVWGQASLEEAAGENLPLGVLDDAAYGQASIPLSPGDQALVYTDGLLEARSPAGELFGVERLRAALEGEKASPADVKARVLGAVWDHTEGQQPDDDMTVLVMEMQ